MTRTTALVSALALAATLGAAGLGATSVQAAPVKHSAQLASKSQLAREHARAIKAGDTANDPYSSASSDALNQQQLAKAQALPDAAAPSTDVQPGAVNSGMTNTSGVDANTNTGTTNEVNNSSNSTTQNDNTMPPASPPVQGTTPDTQNTPQTPPQAVPSTPQPNPTNPSSPQ